MKPARIWLLYGALLSVAAAVAFASRPAGELSRTPSVRNAGPQGLKGLYTYLKEEGRAVAIIDQALTSLSSEVRTLVIPAPTARAVSGDETTALRKFVEGGGTLVYLVPRGTAQPHLDAWLRLRSGERIETAADAGTVDDVLGVTVPVLLPFGAASGLHFLRAGAGLGVKSDAPVAHIASQGGSLVLWQHQGAGEIWILAGPDLAENQRLELLDNLALWEQLSARGLIAFDEFHHRAAPEPGPLSAGRRAIALQLLACALAFAWAKGARLGPPRFTLRPLQRSSGEYLSAMAMLVRRAKVESALLDALESRFRRIAHERWGISTTVDAEELAQQLARQSNVTVAQVRMAFEDLRRARATTPGPRDYERVSQAFARLEQAVDQA